MRAASDGLAYRCGCRFGDHLFYDRFAGIPVSRCGANRRECLQRSPLFTPLTNDSWAWKAVGIPLNLLDKSVEGDIDLMFAMECHRGLESLFDPASTGHVESEVARLKHN
jgi:hypothetical protein